MPIERLTKLIDGIEQLEDMWGDELSDGGETHDAMYGDDSDSDDIVEIQADDGQWHHYNGADDESEWIEDDDDGEQLNGTSRMDVDVDMHDEHAVSSVVPGEGGTSTSSVEQSRPEPSRAVPSSLQHQDVMDEDSKWKRFDILPTAPADHAYYATIPTQPSRAFLTRLQKEYRALSSSLPGIAIELYYCSPRLCFYRVNYRPRIRRPQ